MDPGVPFLARYAVDRRTTERDDAEVDRAWADPAAKVFELTREGKVVFDLDSFVVDRPSGPRPPEAFYLGRDGDDEWFVQVVDVARRGRLGGLRDYVELLSARDIALYVHAVSLLNWHATHTHCPRCGTPTVVTRGGHVRLCPQDDSQHFPRTDPAVIMLITDAVGERALLGRQASWPAPRYSCLAGFVEPGESAEQAVVRETYEETTVPVREVRYVASQPWPFPSSLMLGFRGIADPADPIDVGHDELEDARWFTRDELRETPASELILPGSASIARFLIDGWLAESLAG